MLGSEIKTTKPKHSLLLHLFNEIGYVLPYFQILKRSVKLDYRETVSSVVFEQRPFNPENGEGKKFNYVYSSDTETTALFALPDTALHVSFRVLQPDNSFAVATSRHLPRESLMTEVINHF